MIPTVLANKQTKMSQYLQVQIRPWNLNDSDFVMDGSQPLDPRKTIFVGGVPRPLRAGSYVCFLGSDLPRGASQSVDWSGFDCR